MAMPMVLSMYVHKSNMHAHEVVFNGDILDIFVHTIGANIVQIKKYETHIENVFNKGTKG